MFITELLVRKRTYFSCEYHLRNIVADDDSRFRYARELLDYAEDNPKQTPAKFDSFKKELDTIIGAKAADEAIQKAKSFYKKSEIVLLLIRLLLVGILGFLAWLVLH